MSYISKLKFKGIWNVTTLIIQRMRKPRKQVVVRREPNINENYLSPIWRTQMISEAHICRNYLKSKEYLQRRVKQWSRLKLIVRHNHQSSRMQTLSLTSHPLLQPAEPITFHMLSLHKQVNNRSMSIRDHKLREVYVIKASLNSISKKANDRLANIS